MMTASWPCFGREVRSRAGRLAVALLLAVVAAGVSDGVIWANYSFRFNPTPDGQSWQTADLLHDDAVSEIRARHPDQGVSPAEFEAWRPGAFLRTVQFLRRHRLLPDTYLVGLMYTYSQSHVRPAFLCGRIYSTGSVAYFPLVFAFKTPLATQLLLLLAAVVTIGAMVRRAPVRHDDAMSRSSIAWTAACLWLPFGVIAVAALTAHLNLGIRHILPLYPVLYVAGGCGAARVWRQGGRFGRLALVLLAAGLAAETIAAFPNYIPFFNVACGGSRGGLALLSDSNLDWGQDLPLLAAWQKRNPDRRLYLCYFGSADPLYYGIRYTPLPGTRTLRDKATHPTFPREPGVIAISATQLQGLYLNEQQRQIYGTLRDQQPPLSVLGGSIYLYEYNP
jgi:hypothetical protein